jgi:WhiB family transcriptional regulator, redox-sensing transcriptional regulator
VANSLVGYNSETGANWRADAACADTDAELMFSTAAEQQLIKRLCRRCPVATNCLLEALDNRIEYGVWGGLTERERRALLRKHPNRSSWQPLLPNSRTTQIA